MNDETLIVIGGAGFVGRRIVEQALANDSEVVVVDRRPAPPGNRSRWIQADLLTENIELPEGAVILAHGMSDPRVLRPWTLVQGNALATARLLPHLKDRRITLLSSIEVYGWASGPLGVETEPILPVSPSGLEAWSRQAAELAAEPCPPWRAFTSCSALATRDTSGRWVYALSKAAQESIVRSAVPEDRLTILRIANLFGVGQDRVISRFIRAVQKGQPIKMTPSVRTFLSVEDLVQMTLANLPAGVHHAGSTTISLAELADRIMALMGRRVSVEHVPAPSPDSCGVVASDAAEGSHSSFDQELKRFIAALGDDAATVLESPIQVVIPPRAEHPDLVANRQQAAIWSGRLKYGNRWTMQLEERLRSELKIGPDRWVVATNSGTAALRLGIQAIAGRAIEGDVAVLPSFTFAATGEVLLQLGYRLRFCDVDPSTWTMDPVALSQILETDPNVKLVVPVDTLGNPADYIRLRSVCDRFGVSMVADSAPSIGSNYQGSPVGTQADAHAFSMSFAKAVSAAGAGGAVVVPIDTDLEAGGNWLRSSLMGEINAIAALDQVEILETLVERRETVAGVYRDVCGRFPSLAWQGIRDGDRHSLVHWVVRIPTELGRDGVATALARAGVETKPYYAPVLHEALSSDGTANGADEVLPVTEALAATTLALPMSSEMPASEAEQVGMVLERVIDRAL